MEVIIPFGKGNRQIKGYVTSLSETCNYDLSKVKEITDISRNSVAIEARLIALAAWMYARDRQPVADRLAATFSGLHRAAYRRFYIDEVYQFITHRVIFACISTPIAWFDRHVVDGFMNLLAWGANGAAWLIRDMQSGSVQRYCIWFLGGALGLTILILLIC